MDFELTTRTRDLHDRLQAFMDEHVYPAEAVYDAQIAAASNKHEQPQVMRDLQVKARELGLWNLFMTHGSWGAGLTNLEYAPLMELAGRSIIGPEALNCSAPDTGNMEILAMFGTPEQQEQWLRPLLDCEIRSAFAMTEPAVASSDARNITATICREGDEYVLNGRKWYTSGILDPDCKLIIFMGKSDPGGPAYRQQSMILVPADAPGIEVLRDLTMFGYEDRLGHGEVQFTDVRVPATNMLGAEGDGFAIAQGRLGPGRMHYAMRAIGFAERAMSLMCRRAVDREAFGGPIADQGVVREWIARSRIEIDQARLLTLKASWLMDTQGNAAARSEVAAIKVVAMEVAHKVVDRAVQTHGAAGVSEDTVLARLFAITRALQIADGPNEVHLRTIGKLELAGYRGEVVTGLEGKVALVTGATRGLGFAIAQGLAEAGAAVVVSSRKHDACVAAAESITKATGVAAVPLALHVGQWDDIEPAIEQVYGELGRLDVLVNNAGIAPLAPTLADVSEALFDKTMEVNLKGPFRLMAVAGARMAAAGGGSIVNISSIGAVRPSPPEAMYAASKNGLNALTLAFAQEYAPHVRVNCVMPGAFATDMADGWDSEFVGKVVDRLPAGRLGRPDEVVGMVVHLAGDAAGYTTGAVIPVDGGRTAVY